MKTKVSYDQYTEEWIELYKQGMTFGDIAKKYKVDKSSVTLRLRNNVEFRPKTILYDKEVQKDVVDMYSSGCSIYAITVKYKVSSSTVKKVLIENGIKVESKRKYDHLKEDFIREYNNGLSLKEISDKYGVSKQTINNYLIENNIERRGYSEAIRKSYLDDNYFKEITKEKSYTLGMIFACGRLYVLNTAKCLVIKVRKEYIGKILSETSKFCDKNEKNFENKDKSPNYILRISSSTIYDDLIKLGLSSNSIDFSKIHIKEFLKGYLFFNCSVNKRNLFVSTFDFTDAIYNKLIELGIIKNLNNKVISSNRLFIRDINDISRIIEEFPFFIDKIRAYVKNNNGDEFWGNILTKYEVLSE